jgi:hypothetical protein
MTSLLPNSTRAIGLRAEVGEEDTQVESFIERDPSGAERVGRGLKGGVLGGLVGAGGLGLLRAGLLTTDRRHGRSHRLAGNLPQKWRVQARKILRELGKPDAVPTGAALAGAVGGIGGVLSPRAEVDRTPLNLDQALQDPAALGKMSMLQTHPILALAQSVLSDSNMAQENSAIIEMEREAQEERFRKDTLEQEKKDFIEQMVAARMAAQNAEHESMMDAAGKSALGMSDIDSMLGRKGRKELSPEEEVMASLGLRLDGSEDEDGGGDPTIEDTSGGAGGSMKASNPGGLRNASLVGFQMEDSSPLQEAYIEETDPLLKDRIKRALMLGGVGSLAGGVLGEGTGAASRFLASRLDPGLTHSFNPASGLLKFPQYKNPMQARAKKMLGALGRRRGVPGLIGAGLGLGAGALMGGLSNRGVHTGFDPSTGTEIEDTDQYRDIFDALEPGQHENNYAVGTRESLMDRLGGDAPSMAFGVDLDEAVQEDPSLAASLLGG